jgi:hypothetical protein
MSQTKEEYLPLFDTLYRECERRAIRLSAGYSFTDQINEAFIRACLSAWAVILPKFNVGQYYDGKLYELIDEFETVFITNFRDNVKNAHKYNTESDRHP